jgi:chromosome segregation ATPase
MSFLTKLFAGEKMQEMAFGTLKGYMRDHGIRYFLVELKGDEIVPQGYAAADEPVVMSKVNMTKLEQILQDRETLYQEAKKQVEAYEIEVSLLNDHISVLTATISELQKADNGDSSSQPSTTATAATE